MWANKFYQSIVGVQKLKLSMQLKGHDGCVNSLNFNPAGDMIASGSDDLKICLWDWSTEKCLLKYDSEHAENVFQVELFYLNGIMLVHTCMCLVYMYLIYYYCYYSRLNLSLHKEKFV